jgi:hypothetical protein
MKFNLLTCATVLALASTSALAETAPAAVEKISKPEAEVITETKTPRIFEQLDADKDGKVSPQEAQVSPALVKGFEKIDTNKDGFLTPDEFSQLQVEASAARTYVVLASLTAA